MNKKELVHPRIVYLDTIRFMAGLWVFTTHYIASYRYNVFKYWTVMPFSLFLEGVTGSMAVTVFCVVLGYLAYESGKGNISTFRYAIKRYIYFLALALFLNTLHVILTQAGFLLLVSQPIGVRQIIYSSVFLKSDIVGLFWCLRPLYAGSLLCFINGKYNLSYKEVLIQSILFIFIGQTWIGIVLLGNLAELLLREAKITAVLHKKWIQLLLILMVSVLIKRPESNTTYLIDGFCMMVVVLIFANNRWVRAVLEHKWLQNINRYYMGVYLNHIVVYTTVVTYLFKNFNMGNSKLQFVLAYIVSLVLIILLAHPLEYAVNTLAKILLACLDFSLTRCKALCTRLKVYKQ